MNLTEPLMYVMSTQPSPFPYVVHSWTLVNAYGNLYSRKVPQDFRQGCLNAECLVQPNLCIM